MAPLWRHFILQIGERGRLMMGNSRGRRLLIFLAATLVLTAGRLLGRQLALAFAPEPLRLEAETLAEIYRENPVNGDRLYQNQLLELEGRISAVEKDGLGRPYILLETAPAARCYFYASQQEELARLRPGDWAALSGLCRGYRPSSPSYPAQIELSDCILTGKSADADGRSSS